MKGKHVAAWIVGVVCLLVFSGCNGSGGNTAEQSPEVTQLKAALEETEQQKSQLQSDVQRLESSLNEAESGLAEVKQANDQLQKRVQDLTTSDSDLQAKIQEVTKARAGLESKVDQLTTAKADLQRRVDELAKSRDGLQTMVESLVDTRGMLEKQVAGLTKAKNAALEDAKTAQTRVDQLSVKLKAQTQQMIELQEQMTTIRSVLQQLQEKLE